MNYKDRIRQLAQLNNSYIIDLKTSPDDKSPPTQASSEFTIKREQGDWAERLVQKLINNNGVQKNLVAVHYGKSDNLVAGEPRFEELYEAYQKELKSIGKRPDLLIFEAKDYNNDWNFDISCLPKETLDQIVPRAIAGLEVRSSSFLVDQYNRDTEEELGNLRQQLLRLRDETIGSFGNILPKKVLEALQNANEENLENLKFKNTSLKDAKNNESIANMSENLEHIRKLRDQIKAKITKRDYLSFTPKVEDLYFILKWIETYGIPHYYFQVFFDRVYGISFERILDVISKSENKNKLFTIEKHDKNQFKQTIHVRLDQGVQVAQITTIPTHTSDMKQLSKGRLLFYVKFENGEARLCIENLLRLLNLTNGT